MIYCEHIWELETMQSSLVRKKIGNRAEEVCLSCQRFGLPLDSKRDHTGWTFEPTNNYNQFLVELKAMSEQLAQDLADAQISGRTVTLEIKYDTFEVVCFSGWSRQQILNGIYAGNKSEFWERN